MLFCELQHKNKFTCPERWREGAERVLILWKAGIIYSSKCQFLGPKTVSWSCEIGLSAKSILTRQELSYLKYLTLTSYVQWQGTEAASKDADRAGTTTEWPGFSVILHFLHTLLGCQGGHAGGWTVVGLGGEIVLKWSLDKLRCHYEPDTLCCFSKYFKTAAECIFLIWLCCSWNIWIVSKSGLSNCPWGKYENLFSFCSSFIILSNFSSPRGFTLPSSTQFDANLIHC